MMETILKLFVVFVCLNRNPFVVNKALKDVTFKRMYRSVAGKCSSLSNASHQSSKAAEAVFDVLGRTIPKPNSTRWNSEYNSYRTIFDVKEKLNIVMERLQLPKFSPQDLMFLEEWIEVMKPLAQALDKLQGENTSGAYFGSILPTLHTIHQRLSSASSTYVASLIIALQAGMQRRFGDIMNFENIAINFKMKAFIIAAVSHPYFKVRWIPSVHRKVCEELFVAEVKRMNECPEATVVTASVVSASAGEFYGFYEPDSGSNDSTFTVEAVQYLNDPSHHMNQLSRYPSVKKVFLRFNTTIPSSAPVERLFSQAGLILTPQRNRLCDKYFEKLLLLKKNKQFY